jgi:Uma2 family endonuclease
MSTPLQILETPHLLTVEEYLTLAIDDRTELIEGIIYDISPRGAAHRHAVNALNMILARALGERFTIQVQDAVAIPDWKGTNAPEPDIAVIAKGYLDPLAIATQTFAVVEVSETTYERDRAKMALYVNAGIPSYLVNIGKGQVEAYESAADLAQPSGRVVPAGSTFTILGQPIAVSDLFRPNQPETT